jgi:hypothetical protein
MFTYDKSGVDVTPEQRNLLQSRTFSLRPLSTAGELTFGRTFRLIWLPFAVFAFTVVVLVATSIRYSNPALDSIILYSGLTVLLAYPTIGLGLLVFGVVVARLHARVRWPAVMYWTYWPFWKLAMCLVAAAIGLQIGDYLWFSYFYRHARYMNLQAYSGINPETTAGVRLMDAGIVTFADGTGVDRTKTSTIKNAAVYCIAPILKNGTLQANPNDDSTHDLFMVGTDCCDRGEFRCGDWNLPGVPGGMRLLNEEATAFYRLASQDWAVTYSKTVTHPLFFEWKSDPISAYTGMLTRGYKILALSLLLFPAAAMLAAILLNGMLHLLADSGLATTLSAPLPQGNVGRMLSARFLPDIYKNQEYARSQQQSSLAPDPKYVIP